MFVSLSISTFFNHFPAFYCIMFSLNRELCSRSDWIPFFFLFAHCLGFHRLRHILFFPPVIKFRYRQPENLGQFHQDKSYYLRISRFQKRHSYFLLNVRAIAFISLYSLPPFLPHLPFSSLYVLLPLSLSLSLSLSLFTSSPKFADYLYRKCPQNSCRARLSPVLGL